MKDAIDTTLDVVFELLGKGVNAEISGIKVIHEFRYNEPVLRRTLHDKAEARLKK